MDSNIIQTSKAVSKRFTKGNFTKIRCQSFRITDSSGYIEKKNPEYSEMKPKKKKKRLNLLERGHKMATNFCAIII